jgi:peptide/nickel transport system permease protein
MAGNLFNYLRRNPSLAVGLFILLGLVLFAGVGRLFIDPADARPLSAPVFEPPSRAYPFGTDKLGRDLLATMIVGTPLTLQVGVTAGLLGVGIATVLAFVSAYYGGAIDTVIRWVVDVGLTIPSVLILILIAIALGGITVGQMSLVVASTAWLWPTRTMRSQVLTLKERGYVEVARLSGMGGLEIIVRELMPNLIPVIVANLVSTIASAILATIGLEALGLGPPDAPTLGMTIFWVISFSGVMQGYWWWWVAPVTIIILIFLSLFLASTGLDEIANPRLRKTV